jgi:hypothetical protein
MGKLQANLELPGNYLAAISLSYCGALPSQFRMDDFKGVSDIAGATQAAGVAARTGIGLRSREREKLNQLKLPTEPELPLASICSRRTCWPAVRATPLRRMVL